MDCFVAFAPRNDSKNPQIAYQTPVKSFPTGTKML
jgi:hypothetical protein